MSAALVVAIAAAAVAVFALVGLLLVWWRLHSLRGSQAVLLGGERRDLVDFAVSLQTRIDDLHRAVDEVAAGLSRVDRRVDGAVTNTAVVRRSVNPVLLELDDWSTCRSIIRWL